MAVKIRLARRGRKYLAEYDIVVADARAPRDGRFIEKIGNYNPNIKPSFIKLDEASALKWLSQGAQPTDTVRSILSKQGVMFRKHLQVGVLKKAITQEQADERFNKWKAEKAEK
ncbi:MAG: 30S ribosomal protein S16 [Amoebophilaceae bacterium]|nr:30S ribosomal protein S16 [Amoebophilaceae bacterium]